MQRQVLDQLLRVVGGVLHRHHARAVLAGPGLEQNLVNLEIQTVRQQFAQHRLLIRLEQIRHVAALRQFPRRRVAVNAGGDRLDFSHRQKRDGFRPLNQGRNVVGEQNVHRVRLALDKQVLREFGNRPRLAKLRRVLVSELRRQRPFRARDELRRLASRRDVNSRVPVEFNRLAEQIAVERAAQAAIRAHQNDRTLSNFAGFHERMLEIPRARRRLGQHLVHQSRIRPATQRGLLGLAHFGRRHHLHRLGDLGGVLDRLDAPANVAGGGHDNYIR